jgi:hypothetical protein
MRELDLASRSTLSNADRPRPIGTPVRWERAAHREGQAPFIFMHGMHS